MAATTVARRVPAHDFEGYDAGGKISQWIDDIDAIETFHLPRSALAASDLHSVLSAGDDARLADASTVRGSDSDTIHFKLPDSDSAFLHEEDIDPDDDFFVDAAHTALDKGKAAFAAADFRAADALLREALTMLKELAKKQRLPAETWELRRMLGICAFHVHSAAEAEDALLSVLHHAPQNALLGELQRLQVSQTAHLLAQVYVDLGQPDKAYRYCEYALRGRRRVLGKSHPDSFHSLALMARILEVQDNSLRAEFFVTMIPEEEREAYVGQYRKLAPSRNISRVEEERSTRRVPFVIKKTPPPSLRHTISSGESPPAIPARSPSRGFGGTPPRSRSSTLQEQTNLRPESAISGAVSTVSNDSGDLGARTSVSPLSSPTLGNPNAASTISDDSPQDLPQGTPQNTPACLGSYHEPVRQAGHELSSYFPVDKRPRSHRAATGPLPAVAHPSIAAISETHALPSRPPTSAPAEHLLPQPLKPQRTGDLSELPGDSRIASHPNNGPGHSAHSSDTLPADQNMIILPSLPHAPPPRSPLPPLPSASPPSYSIFPSTSQSLPPPRRSPPPAAESISSPPPPLPPLPPPQQQQSQIWDRQSTTSSSYSERPPSTPLSRSTSDFKGSTAIAPDFPPEFRNAQLPETSRRRKASLMSKFRKNSANASSDAAPRSEAISYSGGVRLTRKDLDSIKHDALTDEAIDFWEEYLEHDMLGPAAAAAKFVLVRPVRTALLACEADDPSSSQRAAALPDLSAALHVLLPLKHPRSGHWSLLLLSPQDGLACHYDPRTPRNRSIAESVARRVAVALDRGSPHGLRFLDVPNTPELVHDRDSGVFVCDFMQHLLARITVTHVSQKVDAALNCKAVDVKAVRKSISKAVETMRKGQLQGSAKTPAGP